jgi:hypothetical protein
MSSWNLKDNLTIDNSKFLKFLDATGVTKNNIMGLDLNSHLHINSSNIGDIYLNSNTTKSNTFINTYNSFGNTFISSKLAVGINSTSNINSNIVLPINGFIGLNSTQGSHSGFLGLAGSSSLLNTSGSKMLLYGVDNTTGNAGQIKLYAGNNIVGNINLYTGNDILRMQVLNNGNTNFQPDGTTIRLAISDSNTTITNKVIISSTEQSTSINTGALQITGGVGIGGNTYINGSLNVNSVIGNINFTSSTESTSYTSGATFLVGGLGIQCSTDSVSQTSGGAISIAGGLALGKSAKIGGNITIFNSSVSSSALNGSGVFYGGVGINGQVNIRSNTSSQIRLIPINTGNETSLFFGNQNNYTTTGSWIIGQNINSIGSGKFGIYNSDQGNYIILESTAINLEKYTNIQDTLNFNSIINDNLITIKNTSGNINWSIGKISNENFQISRFSSGNFLNYVLTANRENGNLTIFGTENSLSLNNGGALTVLGGASITKNLIIGGNIVGGNINFNGNLISNSTVDVNSLSYLRLTSTAESLNLTSGSLVSLGGISIKCTTDTVSSTNGGSFVTAGGVGIAKSLIVGNTITSSAISTGNATITNSTISNIYSVNNNITNITSVNLLNTNSTLTNIVNINSTITNAIITYSTIANINTNIGSITNLISTNISTNSIILSSITATNTLSTNISSSNATITNLLNTNSIINNLTLGTLLVTSTANLSNNSNTIGGVLFTTGGNIGIGINSPGFKLDINGGFRAQSNVNGVPNPFLVGNSNPGSSAYGIIQIYNDTGNNLSMFLNSTTRSTDGGPGAATIRNDGGSLRLSSLTSNLSFLYLGTSGNIGVNTGTPQFTLDVNGTFRSQSIISINNTVNNISNTIGTVNFSSDIALSNSTRNSIIFSQAGINPPTFTTRSIGTKLNLYPNISGSNMDYSIGVETNSMWYSSPSFKWYSNVTSANMILTNSGLGINTNNINPNFALEVIGTGKISSSFSGLGNSNTLGPLITTSGNVGINIVNPNYTLDVNGTGRFSTSFSAIGNSNTIGNIFTTGGNVGIQNISPNQRLELSSINYASNQDGGLRISTQNYVSVNDPSYRYIDIRLKSDTSSNYRGSIIGTLSGGVPTEYEYASFSQDGFTTIYSKTQFKDPTSCSNSSIASVVLSGGLSINCPTNATNVSNGGALTVLGGASIAGDLIIGGSIFYSESSAAASSVSYLTITATNFSTNIANGALISFGGISIQCSADSFSSTQGNAMTIAGGVGIGASLYVGTTGYIPNVVSTNNTTVNAVFTSTSTANSYITNGLRSGFNSNTLGNLFTTGGNIGIGLVNPERQLHVNNSIRIGGTGILDLGNDSTTQIYRNLSDIRFTTNNIDRFIISSTGNIGVGNINPSFALDITGITNLRTTSVSSNSTTGGFISNGGVSVSNTSNATSTTMGGALTIAGGASIAKDVYVGGTITSSSDKFLKKNITHLPSILDKIDNINPIKYNSINEYDTKNYIGFIAQEFTEHFPELLRRENEDSFYSLGYDRITALNFKCIKELLSEVNKLKVIINSLTN